MRDMEKSGMCVEGKNISLGYEGRVIAEHISFSIRLGDYVCIVGKNGAGKTTLMNGILCLRKPLSGEIRLGEGIKRNEIGYLPQQTPVQKDFPASVSEIVLSGCQGRRKRMFFYEPQDKKLAMENMEKTGIDPLAKRCYRELSGGQKQRVLLARALCAAEKLLLLDEPVAGLDPQAAEDMYRIIEELNRREKMTIIMITHDISAALKYADTMLHIDDESFCCTKEAYSERLGCRCNIPL